MYLCHLLIMLLGLDKYPGLTCHIGQFSIITSNVTVDYTTSVTTLYVRVLQFTYVFINYIVPDVQYWQL